ncbi:MAG: hypothetical protein JO007_18555 [Alphaproteobacteria bacterium]|nr:hypothetical protein [Alphaproteobacteria bacterium]
MADDGGRGELFEKGLAMHTTVYCGVPAALESVRIASEVLREEDVKKR